MLRDLVEHFSSLDLTIANLPEDELGQGYEYLIKKFADDTGDTAAEFYTNRTVVHLMTEMLQPQPGESIYDPTCGSGGMLLSAIAQLRQQGQEWRNVRLYGQERNLITPAIACMNCFLHGISDFQIVRGDTVSPSPSWCRATAWMRFDVVLANPPYSIKLLGISASPRNGDQDRRADFEVFVSQVVLEEAGAGDQEAARQRLKVFGSLALAGD